MIRSYKSNPFNNLFLMLIFSIVSVRFLIHGSYHLGLQNFIKPDSGNNSILFLIIAPSSYLYYKSLIYQKKTFNFLDLKHLLFIVFLFAINSISALETSFIFYFGPITNFYYVAFFIIFYLVIIFKLLSKNIWFRKNLLLNNEHFYLIKNWTIYFYTINALCSILLLISIYREFDNGHSPSGKSMGVFILLFWLFIFFKILISPEILFGLPILNKTLLKFNDVLEVESELVETTLKADSNWKLEINAKQNSQDQKLQENIRENIVSYIKEVDKLSDEKLIFRNQKISQNDIALQLGVPTSHIVYLFKYHSNISFSDYRMKSRIKDAINLINANFLSSETFESLAYKTGFSSYNPFFLAFKKVTTFSPQEYMKQKNT